MEDGAVWEAEAWVTGEAGRELDLGLACARVGLETGAAAAVRALRRGVVAVGERVRVDLEDPGAAVVRVAARERVVRTGVSGSLSEAAADLRGGMRVEICL